MAFTPRTAGDLTTEVLARVRDANGVMHTASFVRSRLSDAQRCLNALLGFVVGSGTMTIGARQNFYVISTAVPSAIRITSLRGGSTIRDIGKLPSLNSLLIYGPTWPQKIGDYIETWTLIGRDVLVHYPALNSSGSIGVYYHKLTTALTATGTALEFSPDQDGLVVTLAEAILLLRQRDLTACSRALDRLKAAIRVELVATPLTPTPFNMLPPEAAA